MSKSTADKAKEKAAENGIDNPSGAFIAAFAPMYLAAVPLTSYLCQANSTVEKIVNGVLNLLSSATGSTIPSGRVIPAISAMYVFWTFGATGAFSAAGQAMARDEGLDNNSPRAHLHKLSGLPLRLRSAHYGLAENFPAFALAAALAQSVGAGDRVIINLLGFHALLKMFVYYPSYLADVPPPRTLSHVLSIAATVNVLWRLAVGSK